MSDIYLEIRDQPHQMWAEGSSDKEPTVKKIESMIIERGFKPSKIDIHFDNMMGFWRFLTDIEKI